MEGTKSYVVNSDKSMVILYMNAAVGAKYMTGGSYFGHMYQLIIIFYLQIHTMEVDAARQLIEITKTLDYT